MTRSSWLRLLSLLFAFALVGAACGGSSSDAADSADGALPSMVADFAL